MRSMMRDRCTSSLKTTSTGSSMPCRSTYTWSKRFTRMSEISGSSSSSSSRTQPEQLVQDVTDERLAFEETQRDLVALGVEHPQDHAANLGLRLFAAHAVEALQVESVQQPLVDAALQFLVLRVSRVDATGGWRAPASSSISVRRHERPVSRPKMLLPPLRGSASSDCSASSRARIFRAPASRVSLLKARGRPVLSASRATR